MYVLDHLYFFHWYTITGIYDYIHYGIEKKNVIILQRQRDSLKLQCMY